MNHKRVVHSKKSRHEVYIGRPSKWGNPFSHLKSEIAQFKVSTRLDSIQEYAYWIHTQEQLIEDLYELSGSILGCFCDPNLCHGTVLAELADRLEEDFEEVSLEFSLEEDNTQPIYNKLFNLRSHIIIRGSKGFTELVKSIVNHLNRTKEFKIIILQVINDDNMNTITHRKEDRFG